MIVGAAATVTAGATVEAAAEAAGSNRTKIPLRDGKKKDNRNSHVSKEKNKKMMKDKQKDSKQPKHHQEEGHGDLHRHHHGSSKTSPDASAAPTATTMSSSSTVGASKIVDESTETTQIEQMQFLGEELFEHNQFFDMLVDMMPRALYLAGQPPSDYDHDDDEKNKNGRTKTTRNASHSDRTSKNASKNTNKKNSQHASSSSAKPLQQQQQQQQQTKKVNIAAASKDLVDDAGKDAGQQHIVAINATNIQPTSAAATSSSSRIEALRAKLHAKLAQKRQHESTTIVDDGNGALTTTTTTPEQQISKRAARRVEKRRRQEEAIAAAASNNKRSKTAPTTHGQQQPLTVYHATAGNGTTMNNNSNTNAANDDDDDGLKYTDFGHLAGLNEMASNYLQTNKALQHLNRPKNLQKVLADAVQKRAKLQQLASSTDASDQAAAAAIQWKDVMQQADGMSLTKSKSAALLADPTKLKKQLQRKAAKKAKSAKAWQQRTDQQQHKQQERQTIRSHNLQARKKGGAVGANLSKHRIVADRTTATTTKNETSTRTTATADTNKNKSSNNNNKTKREDVGRPLGGGGTNAGSRGATNRRPPPSRTFAHGHKRPSAINR